MNKLLITGCLLATAFAAVAMPNKKELAAAQNLAKLAWLRVSQFRCNSN